MLFIGTDAHRYMKCINPVTAQHQHMEVLLPFLENWITSAYDVVIIF